MMQSDSELASSKKNHMVKHEMAISEMEGKMNMMLDEEGGSDHSTASHMRVEIPTVNPPHRNWIIGVTAIAVCAIGLGIAGVVVAHNRNDPSPTPSPPKPSPFVPSFTPDIDAIKKRDALRCGIPLRTQGFASQNANGDWEGMDIEHCKAIAAAILGEPNVEYVNTDLVNRWADLHDNKFDILTRATVTMQREVWIPEVKGTFHFSNPYFYDGLRYGGIPSFVECAENEGEGCTGLKVCTLAGSSHAQIVTDLLFGKAESITFQFEDDFHQSFIDGECNVIAGEMVELSEQTLREAGYEGDYTIGQELLSKEPITFASRTEDYVLKDIITWVFEQLHQSDEAGVGIENCENVLLQTELGVSLKKSLRNAVCAVGNYGEVYQRTLEPIVPRSGLNLANDGTTGLLYSQPFGSINIEGPQLNKVSKTVEKVRERGFLNCGINIRAGFASFDPETREYSGFDVDLCNLIASAIFDGVPRVLFTDLPARDRFQVLADQEIDVLVRLSTWTIVRDFMEPSSGVGFAWSPPPYFWDGFRFGGLQPYLDCALNGDTGGIDPICSDLRVCVLEGTTTFARTAQLVNPNNIITVQSFEDEIAGLNSGTCNVIAGGFHDIAVQTVQDEGFNSTIGTYEIGARAFSREPLSVATNEGDPIFSALIKWNIMALIYAEEQNITKANAQDMPHPRVFGPLFSSVNMFENGVSLLGNYDEAYDAAFESFIPRDGLNTLNDGSTGQFYSLLQV